MAAEPQGSPGADRVKDRNLSPFTVPAGLLFASGTVSSGWIRVGGILFALIGCQYLGTAAGDREGLGALGFYRATVWSRVALAAAFGLLVALGQSPPGLLVLGAVNLVGAGSMHLALRRSSGAAGGVGGGAGPLKPAAQT
ncbi:hypothetical protein TSOC_011388 [Tetrabaena socialis]|uniref:Uncharacterized protein n=1 Tax=Tetrabaena socialis TaxID=47790 RepID=A0A2J7ZQV0_9CHLO|nr:hypothetical protein TSOC_011388 [Tetrabaena socialis]|eukprot:PNH02626.1 hypothetical protein TSOC_011388 [Tetrabaena socialis]